MLPEQIKPEDPYGRPYDSSQTQQLEARDRKRPLSEFQLPEPALLASPAPNPSRKTTHLSDLASPSETAALDPVSHSLGVQGARIEAQVAQLRMTEGAAARWKAGDTVETTAAEFRVHSEAVEVYFRELAGSDKDGQGKREREILENSSWPAHR